VERNVKPLAIRSPTPHVGIIQEPISVRVAGNESAENKNSRKAAKLIYDGRRFPPTANELGRRFTTLTVLMITKSHGFTPQTARPVSNLVTLLPRAIGRSSAEG
jgi:hypothetical protein